MAGISVLSTPKAARISPSPRELCARALPQRTDSLVQARVIADRPRAGECRQAAGGIRWQGDCESAAVPTDSYSFGIDHPGDLALTTAAYHCDPLGIARALRAGALVDVASANGFTPLMWVCFRSAVGFDPLVSARWLLAAGADVNRIGGNLPATALTLACEMHNATLVGLLIKSGADPDPPRHVDSPLHCALPADDVVALLIAAGADRHRIYRGQTALERYVEGWVDPRSGDPARDARMQRLLG
jgi:hypothetical protein